MARPREFELDTALEGAMQIFWRQGYGATNLPDLLKAMGLTRGSFYKAFGDKRSVYLEALKRYDENNIAAAVRLLGNAELGDGPSRIEKLFEGAFDDAALESERRGCLVCNAMVELAPSDPEVAQLTAAMSKKLQDAFAGALGAGSERANRAALAQQAIAITNLYFGAQAMSKTGQKMPDWSTLLSSIIATPA